MVLLSRIHTTLLAVCIAASTGSNTNAYANPSMSTFQLLYNGIVSPPVTQSYHQSNSDTSDSSTIPYNMVSDLSTSFMTDVIQIFTMTMEPAKTSSDFTQEERTLEMDQRCYQEPQGGGRCTVDHHKKDKDLLIHLDSHFYSEQDQHLLRLEVSITSSSSALAKDVLVKCIPKINSHIENYQNVVWTIQERISPVGIKHPTSVAASHVQSDLIASSVETLILSQHTLQNRMRIASNMTHKMPLEVWQYHDPTFTNPIRSLFVNGQLLTTTHTSGTAHAEALVHPALISSRHPEYIVIVALDPTPLLKEVLKHKGVKRVVLVGLDRLIVALTQRYMPQLDDCTFLGTEVSSCISQPIVEIVDLSAQEWMKQGAESAGPADVVYVDVQIPNDDWLEMDFQKDVYSNFNDESVLVVAAGSQPKLFQVEDDDVSPRDYFVRHAYRKAPNGIGYLVGSVYDEPLAAPCASAFFIFFPDDSETYVSFVRTNTPAIDIDVVAKLHTNIAGLPTLLYDGMTHTQYNTISRAWEHWYCKSLPGRNLPICNAFLQQWFDAKNHFYDTEVRHHPIKGRALYAAKDCPAGHYVLPHDAALSLHIDREKWLALNKFVNDFPAADMYRQVRDFFITYGFESEPLGKTGWSVSIACNNTFTNHACTDDDNNVIWMEDAYFGEDDNPFSPFSPPLFRKAHLLAVLVQARRDIPAGTEMMIDYSAFRERDEEGAYHKFLHGMCTEGVGLVPTLPQGDEEGQEPQHGEL